MISQMYKIAIQSHITNQLIDLLLSNSDETFVIQNIKSKDIQYNHLSKFVDLGFYETFFIKNPKICAILRNRYE